MSYTRTLEYTRQVPGLPRQAAVTSVPTMNHQPHNKSNRNRVVALALLGASILAASMWMAVRVPLLSDWPNLLGREGIVRFDQSKLSTDHHFAIDLSDGGVKFRHDSEIKRTAARSNGKQYAIELNRSDLRSSASGEPYVMVISDEAGVVEELPLPLRLPVVPYALDMHLVIGYNNEKLCWVNPVDGELHQYDFYRTSSLQLIPIADSRRFILVGQGMYPLTGTPQAGTQAIEPYRAVLLEIDEQLQLQTIWSRTLPYPQSVSVEADRIYVLSPSGNSLDCFSSRDGELLEQIPLPAEFIAEMATNPGDISLANQFLSIHWPTDRARHWTVPDMVPLQFPDKDVVPVRFGNSKDLIGYCHESGWKFELTAYDRVTHKDIWTYSGRGMLSHVDAHEQGLIYFVTSRHGACFDAIDIETGKVVAHTTPFAWFSWLLPTTIVAFVMWCILAIQSAAGTRWQSHLAWLLPLLPLSVLLTHLSVWQMTSSPSFVHNYIQGIFVGLLSTCSAWVVWGSGRPVVRLVPFVVVLALLIGLARLMLDSKELIFEAVWTSLSIVVFPVCVFGVMRLIGVRAFHARPLNKLDASGDSNSLDEELRPTGLPLRDLFLLCTAAAVLLAAAQPLLSMLQLPRALPPGFYEAAIATSIMLLGLSMLAVLGLRGWSKTLSTVALIVAAAIALEATYGFATGVWLVLQRDTFAMVLFRGVATTWLVFSLMLQTIDWSGSRRLFSNTCT